MKLTKQKVEVLKALGWREEAAYILKEARKQKKGKK